MKQFLNLAGIGALLLAAALAAPAATNDLTATIQKGLFEEEANHNLEAAIAAYQSVAAQFDKDRKLAATAIFRLGECYRKAGKTNESAIQYQRVIREFADQTQLVALSRSNLSAGDRGAAPPVASSSAGDLGEVLSSDSDEIARVSRLIIESPDLINAPQQNGRTLLQTAAAQGKIAMAEMLLRNGAAVNGPRQPGETPLHAAAENGHKAMVDLLIKKGANVNSKTESGVMPLHLAAFKGYEAVAKTLLDAGAAVNALTTEQDRRALSQDTRPLVPLGQAPLHLAASYGYQPMVDLLLAKGADVNAVDISGRTALSYAVQKQFTAIMKALLAAKANPNAGTRDLPLSLAAYKGDIEIVKVLLNGGAEPNPSGLFSQAAGQAMGYSSPRGSAPYDAQTKFSPLFLAVYAKQDSAVRELIRAKANVKALDPLGYPLLYDALSDLPTLKALLEAGADPNQPLPDYNLTLLSRVVGNPTTDAAEMLLEHGANVNAAFGDNNQYTPIYIAALYGNLPMAKLLLKKGADPNAPGPGGRTPLHAAVEQGFDEIVELLLANRANPNLQDEAGKTPLDLALAGTRSAGYFSVRGVPRTLLPGPTGVPAVAMPVPSPRASAKPPQPRGKAVELLSQHGGVADLPRMDRIEARRASSGYASVVFTSTTNDWNHFTLLEVLGIQFGFLAAQPAYVPEGSRANYELLTMNGLHTFAYPDIEHVRVRTPAAEGREWKEKSANLSALVDFGDCSRDVGLNWGDVVEIPEMDHPVGNSWLGFTAQQLDNLAKCFARQVEIAIKGKATKVALVKQSPTKIRANFWIKPALMNTGLVLASSDLSRVKVIRHNPATGEKQEYVLNCADENPYFWVKDGDNIEIPEKP